MRHTALSDQLVQLTVRVDEMDATRPTKRVVAPPEDVAGYVGYLSWAASLDKPPKRLERVTGVWCDQHTLHSPRVMGHGSVGNSWRVRSRP
jgi:hypothetical protein